MKFTVLRYNRKGIAANAVVVRFDDGERDSAGNRGINCIAAPVECLEPCPDGERLAGGDDVFCEYG